MLPILILLTIEFLVFHAIFYRLKDKKTTLKWVVISIYLLVSLLGYAMPIIYRNQNNSEMGTYPNTLIFVPFVLFFIFKTLFAFILLFTDAAKAFKWIINKVAKPKPKKQVKDAENLPLLSRSKFLVRSAGLVASAPVAALSFGIASGAHDYRVRRETIKIKGLPKAFNGLRLAQLSDIHSGSFWNKTAVVGGVEMLNAEKPDLVCFTGDLVNSAASEMNNYMNVFNKVKADMGVFSIIGNHDYGNYVHWNSPQDKEQKFEDFLILLSHDPTHWRGEVLPKHESIQLTLSGHTHGMQFGVETENFKWSPVQYLYKEWAGLYQENNQQLYVNRGFGYLGYPGRFGILPEITILTLEAV